VIKAPDAPVEAMFDRSVQNPPDLDLLERLPKFPEVYNIPDEVRTIAWQSAMGENPLSATIAKAGSEEALIVVPAGTYCEALEINHSTHFVGNGNAELASDAGHDSVQINAENGQVTFDGFRITMLASDAYSPIRVTSGLAVFKNCTIESKKTAAVSLLRTGRAVFIGCKVRAGQTPALEAKAESSVFAQNCTFRNTDKDTVLVNEKALARFDGCSVESCGESSFTFRFDGSSSFLFENSRIFQPFKLGSNGEFTVVRNCRIETRDLKVSEATRCLFDGCTFEEVALEVTGGSGVRVVNSRFVNGSVSLSCACSIQGRLRSTTLSLLRRLQRLQCSHTAKQHLWCRTQSSTILQGQQSSRWAARK
jgi:hypothetical protein